MVQRVVLGNLPGGGAGLRVSRPGVNVLTPSLDPSQLSFDTTWLRTLKVFMSGTVSVPVATAAQQFVNVNFGTTFAEPPICMAWIVNPQGSLAVSGQNKMIVREVEQGTWWNETQYTPVVITTSQIRFLRAFSTGYGAYTGRYIVLVGA